MKKVFLENLPTKEGIGSLKGKKVIDWINSVGYKVPFIYDDIEGEIEIIDFNRKNRKLTIKYEGNISYILNTSFVGSKIGSIIGKNDGDFKYIIGKHILDDKRDLVLIDREYRRKYRERDNYYENEKYYKYKCNKCGNIDWIKEGNLKCGNGCKACCKTGRKTPKLGINTIWDTDRWMVDLGVSEEDAKKYTKGTNKKVAVKCSNCNRVFDMMISNIYRRKSIGCTCGDNVPYTEKILFSVIKQLHVDVELQYSAEWSNKKKYDFYIPSLNCIIETHGIQHYEQTRRKGARTLEEERENDKLKKELALVNGIKHYIVLDCRYSDLEYIKNSVLNSKLNELFDLSQINWLRCEEFALSNLVKEVCDYWNNKEEWETTATIAMSNKWGIKGVSTVRNYLKKGTKLGWCNYDGKKELIKTCSKNGKFRSERIKDLKNKKVS